MNERLWDIGGMLLTIENRGPRGGGRGRGAFPSANLSTTDLTANSLGLNPGLRDDRPGTNCLRRGTALVNDVLSL